MLRPRPPSAPAYPSRCAELHPTKTSGHNFFQMIAVPEAFFDELPYLDERTIRISLDLMRRVFGYTIIPGDAAFYREAVAEAGLDPDVVAAWLDRTELGQGSLPDHLQPPLPESERPAPSSAASERARARTRRIDQLVERDGPFCGLCGFEVDLATVHMDHHVPKSWGGGSRLDNLQLAHGDCNTRKGARLISRVLTTPLATVEGEPAP